MQETQFVRLIKRQDLNVKSVQTSIALFRCLRVAQPPTNLDPRRAAAAAAAAEKQRVALNENPPPPPPRRSLAGSQRRGPAVASR